MKKFEWICESCEKIILVWHEVFLGDNTADADTARFYVQVENIFIAFDKLLDNIRILHNGTAQRVATFFYNIVLSRSHSL
jgi:hypothetical protein